MLRTRLVTLTIIPPMILKMIWSVLRKTLRAPVLRKILNEEEDDDYSDIGEKEEILDEEEEILDDEEIFDEEEIAISDYRIGCNVYSEDSSTDEGYNNFDVNNFDSVDHNNMAGELKCAVIAILRQST